MSFRRFSRGDKFLGGRGDMIEEAGQKGAMVIFDAWEKNNFFQYRLWHCTKDLEIKLGGSGFKEIERETISQVCQYWCHDTDKEMDFTDYCTTVRFSLSKTEGSVSVGTSEDCPLDEVVSVSWSGGKIIDLDGEEAHLDFVSDYYKTGEILTLSQRKYFVIEDRFNKLLKISRVQSVTLLMNLYRERSDILNSANMSDEEYVKWVQEEESVKWVQEEESVKWVQEEES
jgi:hypothetical protein